MNDGFIVLNRRIDEWQWWGVANAVHLWVHILHDANWRDGYWHGVPVPRGSFITSIGKLADECNVSMNTVRRWLKAFQDAGQIEVKTTNKYTHIFVINYAKYQGCFTDVEHQTEQQTEHQTEHQTAHNRTRRTNKQINNSVFTPPTVDEVQAYITEKGYTVDAERFVDYYTANGWKVGKVKMADWRRTVNNWQRNEKPQKITPEYTTKQDEQASADELAQARAMLERLKK